MYILLFGLLLVLLGIASLVVRHYSNPNTSHPLSTLVTLIALVCALMCVFILPLDVFVVSGSSTVVKQAVESGTSQAVLMFSAAAKPLIDALDSGLIKFAYYSLFGVVAALAFVVFPFTYFFVEDSSDDADLLAGEKASDCFDRATSALRNTVIFGVIVVILLLAALFYRPVTSTLHSDQAKDVHHWVDTMVHEWDAGVLERGLTLAVGCMTILGLLNLCYYTAYGVAALPLALLRSRPALQDQQVSAEYSVISQQQRLGVIEQRLSDPTTSDKLRQMLSAELAKARAEERVQQRRAAKLAEMENDWTSVVWTLLAPIRFTLGVAALVVSLSIMVTLALSAADMWLHSDCGFRCGFVADRPLWLNIADRVLVWASGLFPMDFVAFGVLMSYLFACTLFGIANLGIRFFHFQVFEIKPRRTWPQAMLMLCAILMFTLLAIMVEATAIAPQYATFGRQMYIPAHAPGTPAPAPMPCVMSQTIHATSTSAAVAAAKASTTPASAAGNAVTPAVPSPAPAPGDVAGKEQVLGSTCTPTRVRKFMTRLTAAYPFFSIVFYGAHWAFVFVVVVVMMSKCRRKPKGAGAGSLGAEAASDDDEDEELRAGSASYEKGRFGVEARRLLG